MEVRLKKRSNKLLKNISSLRLLKSKSTIVENKENITVSMKK